MILLRSQICFFFSLVWFLKFRGRHCGMPYITHLSLHLCVARTFQVRRQTSKMGVEVLKSHVELALSNLVPFGFVFFGVMLKFSTSRDDVIYLPFLSVYLWHKAYLIFMFIALFLRSRLFSHLQTQNNCLLLFIQDCSFVLKAVAKFLSSFPSY